MKITSVLASAEASPNPPATTNLGVGKVRINLRRTTFSKRDKMVLGFVACLYKCIMTKKKELLVEHKRRRGDLVSPSTLLYIPHPCSHLPMVNAGSSLVTS